MIDQRLDAHDERLGRGGAFAPFELFIGSRAGASGTARFGSIAAILLRRRRARPGARAG